MSAACGIAGAPDAPRRTLKMLADELVGISGEVLGVAYSIERRVDGLEVVTDDFPALGTEAGVNDILALAVDVVRSTQRCVNRIASQLE